jgi:hypothetical protein
MVKGATLEDIMGADIGMQPPTGSLLFKSDGFRRKAEPVP